MLETLETTDTKQAQKRSGPGAPAGNDNAVKHRFYSTKRSRRHGLQAKEFTLPHNREAIAVLDKGEESALQPTRRTRRVVSSTLSFDSEPLRRRIRTLTAVVKTLYIYC